MNTLHPVARQTLIAPRLILSVITLGTVMLSSGCLSTMSRPVVTQNQAYPNTGVPNSNFYSAPQTVPPPTQVEPTPVPQQSNYRPWPFRPWGNFFRGTPPRYQPPQYGPPSNPQQQIPRVGEPVTPPSAVPSERQPTIVPPPSGGIQERPRTYRQPDPSSGPGEFLAPPTSTNDGGQTLRKTIPPQNVDPLLGAPSDEIVIGGDSGSEPESEFDFLMKKEPEATPVPEPRSVPDSSGGSVPFGTTVDPFEDDATDEPGKDEVFEAPEIDNTPVQSRPDAIPPDTVDPESSSTLTLPPATDPKPADKLFEETAVPPLSDVELLTSPDVEPSAIEEAIPSAAPTESNPFEMSPLDSEEPSGPLLEFNTSALRDDLEVKIVSQERTQVGSGTLFEVYITNRSTEVFRDLTLKAAFNQALFVPNREGDELTRYIPRIDPGQEQKIPLTLFSEQTGYHCVRFSLLNKERNELSWKSRCVTYIPEKIRTEIKGPDAISVDSLAVYTIVVENLSNEDIEDAVVNLRFDPVLKYLGCSHQARQTDQELNIPISQVPANGQVPVRLQFRGVKPSENSSLIVSTTANNLPAAETGSYLSIERPRGALDLDIEQQLELIRPGDDTEVTIICRNRGLETLSGSQLRVEVPSHLKLVRSGWGAQRSTVSSETGQTLELTVPAIPPGISARYSLELEVIEAGEEEVRVHYENPETTPPELRRSFPVFTSR